MYDEFLESLFSITNEYFKVNSDQRKTILISLKLLLKILQDNKDNKGDNHGR